MRPHEQRLQNAPSPDRLGEFVERALVHGGSGLEGIGLEQIERQLPNGTGCWRRLDGDIAEQCREAAAQARADFLGAHSEIPGWVSVARSRRRTSPASRT